MPNGIAIQKYAWSQKMNRRNGIRSYATENKSYKRKPQDLWFLDLGPHLVFVYQKTLYLYLNLKDCVTRALIMRHLQPIG
ncbi:MAG: hypothetical protein EZS28_037241 [Streblomastix strix]|uniref:Uncharacterized protein n=1 Tax=Streblomastix strix TaxID=222440 RepID=A0A5J4UBI2_9EUKA|nr:MAG: hypothetical protein EZS28_037241 [Streblomastix strix]